MIVDNCVCADIEYRRRDVISVMFDHYSRLIFFVPQDGLQSGMLC